MFCWMTVLINLLFITILLGVALKMLRVEWLYLLLGIKVVFLLKHMAISYFGMKCTGWGMKGMMPLAKRMPMPR